MKLSGSSIAIHLFCFFTLGPLGLINSQDTCGGPREDLSAGEGAAGRYSEPGRQVVLVDSSHQFTDCGRISQWNMVFRCEASKDGGGYPLELQVFERTQSFTQYRLVSRVEVTLQDEQCLSQPVTFNVSLPFCQGNRVGLYVPALDGLTGLGYRTTRDFRDAYSERELSAPPSVNETLSLSTNLRALPLVSVAVANCGEDSTQPPSLLPSTMLLPTATVTTTITSTTTTTASATLVPTASATLVPTASAAPVPTASAVLVPTASPRLDLDNNNNNNNNNMGVPNMEGNETVLPVVAAVLLLATVIGMAVAGVFVILFAHQKRTKSSNVSAYEEPLPTMQTASQQSGVESVYSEVLYSEVDGITLSPYEFPVSKRSAPANEVQGSSRGHLIPIAEDQLFLKRASGATINQPALDQEEYSTGWVVPSMDQRRRMEASAQSSAHTYSELQPCYEYCSALEGIGGNAEIPPFVCEPHYEFDSTGSYWKPGLAEEDIYSQMYHWNYREIPRNVVTLGNQLGEGQFGEVYQAEWEIPERGPVDVAVKVVKKGAPQEERLKLLQEAAILGQFRHRHVVSLLGVVTLEEPKMMVMELLQGGNLRKHLMSIRGSEIHSNSAELPTTLLKFCRQVAEGLSYLAGKSFVHRDIAARNILLDKELNCKISDFGMSRDLDEETYYVTKGGRIPIKWTAPEAILYKKYSTSSDIWSYGMLMYEIWSLGHVPFENKKLDEVVKMFDRSDHYCQPPPPGCPRAIYAIMVDCWNPDHAARPSAKHIARELSVPQLELALRADSPSALPACTLGAPLEEGRTLYQDLQTKYY